MVTKGRLLGHNGVASPQVDVIVLHPAYPKFLRKKKLYLADGVAAAFECKLSLKTQHIKKAVGTSQKLKALYESREGTPYLEATSPLIYGLLSHAHSWKKGPSDALDHIREKLYEADTELITRPSDSLDIVCVANAGTYVLSKSLEFSGCVEENSLGGYLLSCYMRHGPTEFESMDDRLRDFMDNTYKAMALTPVGAFLCKLLGLMAREDSQLRRLADYFLLAGTVGPSGGAARNWSLDCFTPETRIELLERAGEHTLKKEVDWRNWDGWTLLLTLNQA